MWGQASEGQGWAVCMLSRSRARQGWAMGEICLVRSRGVGHESSLSSQLSACNIGFLFLVLLPNSILVSPWSGPVSRKGRPRVGGPCWLFRQAYRPLKINALGLWRRNQSPVGFWGNWRVGFLNKIEDRNLPDDGSTNLQLYSRAQLCSRLTSVHQNRNRLLTSLI